MTIPSISIPLWAGYLQLSLNPKILNFLSVFSSPFQDCMHLPGLPFGFAFAAAFPFTFLNILVFFTFFFSEACQWGTRRRFDRYRGSLFCMIGKKHGTFTRGKAMPAGVSAASIEPERTAIHLNSSGEQYKPAHKHRQTHCPQRM